MSLTTLLVELPLPEQVADLAKKDKWTEEGESWKTTRLGPLMGFYQPAEISTQEATSGKSNYVLLHYKLIHGHKQLVLLIKLLCSGVTRSSITQDGVDDIMPSDVITPLPGLPFFSTPERFLADILVKSFQQASFGS